MSSDCPFCEMAETANHSRIIAQDAQAFLIADAYPVSDGHSLIVSKRHVQSFFQTTEQEQKALLRLIEQAKSVIEQKHQPSGYNIGVNDGASAGQTIPHLHIHLIPRYDNDQKDPRGGVRWIFPEKANYWEQ